MRSEKREARSEQSALPRETMIARVREVCQADERLVGALMYGSFARGEGDAYSDIEFALFFADVALPGIDQRAWVGQIAPGLVSEFKPMAGRHR
ncbi:MAG: hypothetical protein ACRDJW_13405 [Thermomicrobiales bacterium]